MALVPDSKVHCSRPPSRNLDLSSSNHAQGPWVGFIYIQLSKNFKNGPGMPLNTRCRACLDQLKTMYSKTAREGFVSMCACTEPVRTGIGAVCVEYGRPKWPLTMLNHTNRHPWYGIVIVFYFLHPMLVRPVMKSFFCLGLGRFAPSALPHYYETWIWLHLM